MVSAVSVESLLCARLITVVLTYGRERAARVRLAVVYCSISM